jgi:hypothetical protein
MEDETMGGRSEEPVRAVPNDPTGDVIGAPVEVRSRFDGTWCRGFEIAEVLTDLDRVFSYRIRRVSDGHTLPGTFSVDDVGRQTSGPQ